MPQSHNNQQNDSNMCCKPRAPSSTNLRIPLQSIAPLKHSAATCLHSSQQGMMQFLNKRPTLHTCMHSTPCIHHANNNIAHTSARMRLHAGLGNSHGHYIQAMHAAVTINMHFNSFN